jgi:hypothetical protein
MLSVRARPEGGVDGWRWTMVGLNLKRWVRRSGVEWAVMWCVVVGDMVEGWGHMAGVLVVDLEDAGKGHGARSCER